VTLEKQIRRFAYVMERDMATRYGVYLSLRTGKFFPLYDLRDPHLASVEHPYVRGA